MPTSALMSFAFLLMTTSCMVGCACSKLHHAGDAEPVDSAIVDGGGGGDVRELDANGDASIGCDFDLGGTWSVTYDRSPHQCGLVEDGTLELATGGYLAALQDLCGSEGCTAENCEVLAARSPSCTATVRYSSPCANFPRGVSYEEVHRVISSNRIEGIFQWRSDLGECFQNYVLTR